MAAGVDPFVDVAHLAEQKGVLVVDIQARFGIGDVVLGDAGDLLADVLVEPVMLGGHRELIEFFGGRDQILRPRDVLPQREDLVHQVYQFRLDVIQVVHEVDLIFAVAQPHVDEAVFVDITGPLKEKHGVGGVDFGFVEATHKGKVGLKLACDEVADLDVELGGRTLEKEGAFGLVAVELSDLQFVDVGQKRDPFVEDGLFEPFETHSLPVPKLLNGDVGVQGVGYVEQLFGLVALAPLGLDLQRMAAILEQFLLNRSFAGHEETLGVVGVVGWQLLSVERQRVRDVVYAKTIAFDLVQQDIVDDGLSDSPGVVNSHRIDLGHDDLLEVIVAVLVVVVFAVD